MIDVVLPAYNQFKLVVQCLDCMVNQIGVRRIVVVDDGSTDPHLVDYLSMARGITVVRHEHSEGFVAAANDGMQHAETEYAVIVNSDVTPTASHSLTNLIVSMNEVGAFVCGPKLLFMDHSKCGQPYTIQHAGVGFDPSGRPYHPFMHLHRNTKAASVPKFLTAVTGAVFAVKTDVWRQIGGFDPLFSPGVYEDVDYCLKAGRVYYEPTSEWLHLMHGSQTSERNLFLEADKHLALLRRKWGGLKCDEELFYGV